MKIFTYCKKSFLASLLVLGCSSALACTSIYVGKFEVFADLHPIIVRATVASHGDALHHNDDYFEEMTVRVTDVVKGGFPHETFVFFGDTGMSCLRYITRAEFPLGSEHLFILESSEPRQPLMVAGESSVRIHGDAVAGRELFEEYSMSLAELLALIR